MSTPYRASSGGGSGYKKKNYFKLGDGDFVCRIVPPIEKFTGNPERGWFKYYAVHFGYKNMDGKLRTFASPFERDYETKAVLTPDAALDRLNDLKEKLAKAIADGNTALAEKLETLVGRKGLYSLDKNYHMNVITLDGTIGELKIRRAAKLALDAEIKRLEDEGTFPLSKEDGRFFVFHREGTFNTTQYKVTVYTTKVDLPNGKKANQEVSHVIGPELWARLENEASNLRAIVDEPTAQQVAEIVEKSDLLTGKSPAVDLYLGLRYKKVERSGLPKANASESDVDLPFTNNISTPGTGQVLRNSSPVIKPVAQPLVTPAVSQPTAKVSPTPAPAVTAKSVDDLSDEDFFKDIGYNG